MTMEDRSGRTSGRVVSLALVCWLSWSATGCVASNRIVGHRIHQSGTWYGELGITGHLNEITILRGSRLNKLSIIGDGNFVVVEDHVTLGKVEIWGENNTVSIPGELVVRKNIAGSRSVVVPRAPGEPPPTRAGVAATQPPVEETPPETPPQDTSNIP